VLHRALRHAGLREKVRAAEGVQGGRFRLLLSATQRKWVSGPEVKGQARNLLTCSDLWRRSEVAGKEGERGKPWLVFFLFPLVSWSCEVFG